jgi:hypothetical protein
MKKDPGTEVAVCGADKVVTVLDVIFRRRGVWAKAPVGGAWSLARDFVEVEVLVGSQGNERMVSRQSVSGWKEYEDAAAAAAVTVFLLTNHERRRAAARAWLTYSSHAGEGLFRGEAGSLRLPKRHAFCRYRRCPFAWLDDDEIEHYGGLQGQAQVVRSRNRARSAVGICALHCCYTDPRRPRARHP